MSGVALVNGNGYDGVQYNTPSAAIAVYADLTYYLAFSFGGWFKNPPDPILMPRGGEWLIAVMTKMLQFMADMQRQIEAHMQQQMLEMQQQMLAMQQQMQQIAQTQQQPNGTSTA